MRQVNERLKYKHVVDLLLITGKNEDDEIVNHYSYESGHAPSIYASGNKIVAPSERNRDGYICSITIAQMNAIKSSYLHN